MRPCKYFLKGDCKFGKNCQYDHPITSNIVDPPEWLLSCFEEDGLSIPLLDYSFEEVRANFYATQDPIALQNDWNEAIRSNYYMLMDQLKKMASVGRVASESGRVVDYRSPRSAECFPENVRRALADFWIDDGGAPGKHQSLGNADKRNYSGGQIGKNSKNNSYYPQQSRPGKTDDRGYPRNTSYLHDISITRRGEFNRGPYEESNRGSYNQNYQRPYNQNYKRPYDQNYQRPYDQNYQKPYDQNYQRPYENNNRGPHEQNYQRPYENNNRGPHEQGYQRPYDQNYQKPHENQNRRPYNNRGPTGRNYQRNYENKPPDNSDQRSNNRNTNEYQSNDRRINYEWDNNFSKNTNFNTPSIQNNKDISNVDLNAPFQNIKPRNNKNKDNPEYEFGKIPFDFDKDNQ